MTSRPSSGPGTSMRSGPPTRRVGIVPSHSPVEMRGEVVEDRDPPSIISAKNSFSQSAPLPYALETTRITQLPPDADSMRNSVAIGVTDDRSWSEVGMWSAIGHGSAYAKRLVGVYR